MRKTAYVALLLLFILAFAISGFSQAAQAPQNKSKAEYDAYKAAYDEKDNTHKAELAAKFLTDFKDSDIFFRTNAYIMMTKAYLDGQTFPKAMDAAAKIDEALPTAKPEDKLKIYSFGMQAATNANDLNKTVEFGDKILAVNPNDANTLITLAGLLPERLPNDDVGKKATLAKAEDYANRALAAIGKIAKPASMSDADWNSQIGPVTAGIHGSLGLIALNRQDYEKSVSEYMQVIKSTPKDGVAQFRLGLAYSGQAVAMSKAYSTAIDEVNAANKANPAADQTEAKAKLAQMEEALRAKRAQATDALATAVALGGPVQQPAMDQLKKLWTGTPEEMDALIAAKKKG
jgi:tetratricopeptide (TPR) repeat protein